MSEMRLADFILADVEPILLEWEAFARSIWPSAGVANVEPAELRNDAEAILLATVVDMQSGQTGAEQAAKSRGKGEEAEHSRRVDLMGEAHGAGREQSGFTLEAVVAEYRALRASVVRLWRASNPSPDFSDLEDLTRFNESIDQSLTEAVRSYTEQVRGQREVMMSREQTSRVQAETANRAKDLFLATLSHELRTPLNAIVGWLRILRDERRSEEDLAEGLDVIERSTMAQVQLIDDILDVSRIVSGKLRLEVRECDLAKVINSGVDAVRPAAEARDTTLDVQMDPSAGMASCDPTRIQQVVWNLVSNAVKFTPKGGRVGVTMGREASSTQIQVSDNGEGISPELLPSVFDPFRQADSSSRRRYSGLGLGLSIVKHIVEQHGGTVEVQSAGPGTGSTFTVRLPIRAVRNAGEQPEAQPDADDARRSDHAHGHDHSAHEDAGLPALRLDGLRVLIVDDEASARRLLVKVLEQVGARATAVASAAEALQVLERDGEGQGKVGVDGVDVLISDIGMPDHDGFDLIRQVRSRTDGTRDLPAVALTAFAQQHDAQRALRAGYQVHLPKPVDLHELTAAIASLARHPSKAGE